MNPLKSESKALRFAENIKCRLCICETVEYLRGGLRPFVPLRLKSACGPNWILKVNDRIDEENKKKGPKDQRIPLLRVYKNGNVQWDSRSLLKAIHFTFKDAFQEEFECPQYRVTRLWRQLNAFSHEKPFDFEETKHTLQGMEYILKAVKALEQAKLVDGVLQRLTSESPSICQSGSKDGHFHPIDRTAEKSCDNRFGNVARNRKVQIMIKHESHYRRYLKNLGTVNDDSIKSYTEDYLPGVARNLNKSITPQLLNSYSAIDEIKETLLGMRINGNTVKNWKTAMRHYCKMCQKHNLQ